MSDEADVRVLDEKDVGIGELRVDAAPQIGIWWLIDGELITHTTPFEKASTLGGIRQPALGHREYWPYLRAAKPELRDKEYTDYPRGRLMYNDIARRFLYMGSSNFVGSELQRAAVLKAFGLSSLPSEVIFESDDEHYRL